MDENSNNYMNVAKKRNKFVILDENVLLKIYNSNQIFNFYKQKYGIDLIDNRGFSSSADYFMIYSYVSSYGMFYVPVDKIFEDYNYEDLLCAIDDMEKFSLFCLKYPNSIKFIGSKTKAIKFIKDSYNSVL